VWGEVSPARRRAVVADGQVNGTTAELDVQCRLDERASVEPRDPLGHLDEGLSEASVTAGLGHWSHILNSITHTHGEDSHG
jgi:hypothetical protein